MQQPESNLCIRNSAESSLVCVVPMYNEQGHARDFLNQLASVVKSLFSKVEIIVVNDGSKDGTDQEVREAIQLDHLPIHYLNFSRNFGKESALTAGLDAAVKHDSDAVLIIDADFEHPFNAINRMVELWQQGFEMIYGTQINRHTKESATKRFLKNGFYNLMSLLHMDSRFSIPKNAGDFRLLDRKVLTALNKLPEKNRYMKGLYAWVGFSTAEVEFEPQMRTNGKSSFSYLRLFELALDGLTSFSISPLRISAMAGIIISFFAFIYGLWIVLEWLIWDQPIVGFTTLAAALMFFSGVQLFFIGIMGEYIGRIFVEVKQRPIYIVSDDIDATKNTLNAEKDEQEFKKSAN